MTETDLAQLLRDCPTLFHMAEAGAWPSIRKHGLLSTSALLDQWQVAGSVRENIESRRRPDSVTLAHAALGRAVVRDQKPLNDAGLQRCLRDGLTPSEWHLLLNRRVFFWLSRARLHVLLNARPYRGHEHDVLELDASKLVSAYFRHIELSPINSGALGPAYAPRGRDTFLPITDYPSPKRRKVVELTIVGGVPDIEPFVRRVTRMMGESELAMLYEASTTASSTSLRSVIPRNN